MDIEVGNMQNKLFECTKNLLAIHIHYAKQLSFVNKSFDKTIIQEKVSDRLHTFCYSLICTISLLPGFNCSGI